MGASAPRVSRRTDRRRGGDLRRVGRAGAGGGLAGASAEGAGDAVHGDQRIGAVDVGDHQSDRVTDRGTNKFR